ncbi:hypothetical protein CTA1_1091 [Colletotrichum tanaceti]|uniref:Uncharacterized protein n=1 Tax=Colletotrichum tanaceti TaxID=1306861 RepID=A0A4U6X5B7_9PEZI|nr:hypothetical protein CTA1_1091 [Colletotrichum tanaceti]
MSYSSPAHPPIGRDVPRLAAHALEHVKQRLGIPLVLDGQQPGVVVAEEGGLPVGLPEVGLVHVRGAAGRHGLDERHELLRHAPLGGLHVGPRRRVVPVGDELELHDRPAPRRVDRVLGRAGRLLVPADAAGEEDAVGGEVPDDPLVPVVVGLEHGAGDQAAAELVAGHLEVALGQGAHVGGVVVAVRELAVGDGQGDADVGQGVDEGAEDDVADVGGRGVPDGQGTEDEELGVVQEDGEGAVVRHGGQQLVELGDGGGEPVGRGGGGEQLEGGAADEGVGGVVGTDGDAGDDAKGAAAAAAEGPVQVRVPGGRGDDGAAVGGDDLEGEGLVGAEAEPGGEGAVASALDEAAGQADGGALARDDGEALGVRGLEDLVAEHAGADVHGRARVVLVGPGGEVDGLEVVGPDGQGTGAGRAAEEAAKGSESQRGQKQEREIQSRNQHFWTRKKTSRG